MKGFFAAVIIILVISTASLAQNSTPDCAASPDTHDPKVMMPMLKQIGVTMPSIAARDFGYQLLPVMALPSNWIVSAKGNVMFLSDESLDKWVDAAAAALEKAAKK